MKYIVYLTTNVKSETNKIYIGVHKTKNPEVFDGYIGCGVYIQQPSTYMYPKTPFQYAVKKYGVDSFKRYILFVYDSAEEAYKKESELVDKDFINQDFTYNMSIGGSSNVLHRKLYQFDIDGNLVKTWDVSKEAYEFYGYPQERFYYAIYNKRLLLDSFWSTTETINIKEYNKTDKQISVIYVYSKKGKLLREFYSKSECAKFCGIQPTEIDGLIRSNNLVQDKYYVSNRLVDEFKPKVRLTGISRLYYVYDINNNYLGVYKGKDVMNVIGTHSWKHINNAVEINGGWYKDYFLSDKEIDKVPEKYDRNRVKVDVFDKYGNFIETMDSINKLKAKYNIPSSKIKNLEQGNKYFNDYIFKYHKMISTEL